MTCTITYKQAQGVLNKWILCRSDKIIIIIIVVVVMTLLVKHLCGRVLCGVGWVKRVVSAHR